MGYVQETLWPPSTAIQAIREGRIFRLDSAREGAARLSIAKAYFVPFRLKMRLVSDDHVFSLAGSAAIAVYCVVVGATAGLLYAGRQRGWRARTRALPAAWCVLLMGAFFFFGTPFAAVAGLLVLAAAMTAWKPAVRWAIAGVAAAIQFVMYALVLIYLQASWGPVADIAGFIVLVPLTLVLAVPVDLALTKRRASELRAPAERTASTIETALSQAA